MSVLQESGANTADVSTSFKEALAELLEKDEFEGVKSDILFDQGDYVKLADWQYRSIPSIGWIIRDARLLLLPSRN